MDWDDWVYLKTPKNKKNRAATRKKKSKSCSKDNEARRGPYMSILILPVMRCKSAFWTAAVSIGAWPSWALCC